MDSMTEDINKLDKIDKSQNKEISDMHQRIYYSNKEIYYGINSSNELTQKMIFPLIKKICNLADEKFIEKYLKNSLEIVVNE